MSETYEEWTIIELMGHRKLAGKVTKATIAGGAFLRIDIPGTDGQQPSTQYYPPASVYCMTPCTEELARQVARRYSPAPVSRWELPAEASEPRPRSAAEDPDDPEDYEEDPEYETEDL